MDARTEEFVARLHEGGQIEASDWLPDEYRSRLVKFVEMHANSELMGVLPERDWILRAPTLQRKLALTAKIQDEVGHAQLIYRVVEDLGKPRSACLDDLIAGKAKFWEESFHILHGRDCILALVTGTQEQFELVQEALERWWEPLMHFHGTPIPADDDPMLFWRIKSQANEDARQQFLDGYVPQIRELGAEVPDPRLRKRDDGVWEYTEPDWEKLKAVVSGHGPASQERLDFRRRSRVEIEWVGRLVLADAA